MRFENIGKQKPFETETIDIVERSEYEENLQDIADIRTTRPGDVEKLRSDVLRFPRIIQSLTQQIQTYMTTKSTMVSILSMRRILSELAN